MGGHAHEADYRHIVFSTKHRRPLIDDNLRAQLWPYLAKAVRNQGCICLLADGQMDHVHLLVRMGQLLVADLIKEIKRTSSIWAKTKGHAYRAFYWQAGYGSFSVSYSNVEVVRRYIANQERHHRRMTWEEEYRRLLAKHGIEFDERYFLD